LNAQNPAGCCGRKGRVWAGIGYPRRGEILGNVLARADPLAVLDGEVLQVSGITSAGTGALARCFLAA